MFIKDPPESLRCSCNISNDNVVTFSCLLLSVCSESFGGSDKCAVWEATGFKFSPNVLLFLLLPLCLSADLCVGFLFTSMLRLLFSSICPAQSKKGRLSPLTSSCLNLMLLYKALICSVKAFTSTYVVQFDSSISSLAVARSSSCEGKQGCVLNLPHVEVGHYESR